MWAANGVVNGNSSVGTIKNPTDTTATYVAPAMKPAANPVSVSATVTDKTTRRKTTLTSNIFVDAHPPLKGIITALTKDGDLVVTSIARVRFIWDDVQAYQPDPLASRLEVNWGASTTACETKATFDGPILRTDAHILFVEQNYFSAGFTNGTVTGTTTCNIGHSLDPFSMNDDLQWWPVPPLPLTVKPDGTLDDGFKDDVRNGSGKTSSSQWILTPEVPPR